VIIGHSAISVGELFFTGRKKKKLREYIREAYRRDENL
jgi:hypothetical protein